MFLWRGGAEGLSSGVVGDPAHDASLGAIREAAGSAGILGGAGCPPSGTGSAGKDSVDKEGEEGARTGGDPAETKDGQLFQ